MKKIIYSFLIMSSVVVVQGCANLDSEVYSTVLPKDFYKNKNQLDATVAAAYTPLYGYWGTHEMQDLTTDQSTVPVRSNGGWDDGGLWPRLVKHDFRPNETVGGPWNSSFSGVSSCNRIMEILANYVDPSEPVFAELKTLRAFYYWVLLDLYGNVPIETNFSTANPQPTQSTPAQVYAFIEKELLAAVDLLPTDKAYAKVNRWVGYTLLAKLYLNAERYGAGPQWQKAADAANKVINSGAFVLEPGYFTNFRIDNTGSKENIFVVPYDKNNAGDFSVRHQALHQSSPETFGFTAQPWGGYSVQAEFYNSYAANDKRRGMFIVGQQYTQAAGPQWDNFTGFSYSSPKDEFKLTNCVEDYNNLSANDKVGEDCNVFITVDYTLKEEGNYYLYKAGARYGKYEYDQNAAFGMNNDFAIFRYADVLLMRAEALWRLSNGSAEALSLVNQVRSRAGVDPLVTLSEDDLYWEIKKELALENQARPVTIRFGHYEDTWFLKTDNDVRKRLFPIPVDQMQSNPKLVQNPGYN